MASHDRKGPKFPPFEGVVVRRRNTKALAVNVLGEKGLRDIPEDYCDLVKKGDKIRIPRNGNDGTPVWQHMKVTEEAVSSDKTV